MQVRALGLFLAPLVSQVQKRSTSHLPRIAGLPQTRPTPGLTVSTPAFRTMASVAGPGSPQNEKQLLSFKILKIKKQKGLKWADIAKTIDKSPVWTAAACLGEMSTSKEEAAAIAKVLGLSKEEESVLESIPYRGTGHLAPPTDPLVYRFHELVSVYGNTFKEIINEEFGDGIMSAIDFSMDISRQPDPKGDRVKIVMSGKFLPYRKY